MCETMHWRFFSRSSDFLSLIHCAGKYRRARESFHSDVSLNCRFKVSLHWSFYSESFHFIEMDFARFQCNSDLKCLEENLNRGTMEEIERLCKQLSNTYDEVARWIKRKGYIEKPELLEKDVLGQTLIPDDITLAEENPRWLACKTTGDGDCLFNSVSRILVGNESLCYILCLLTAVELYINCKHSAFQEYLNACVINGYDEDTLFTMCLTAHGIAAWDGKDRISAIKGEAKRCSQQKAWCGTFHIMALASVIGRPLHSVYPNAGSRIREFLHRKILPRSVEQGNQDIVYIMWSRDGTLDSAPGSWYQPNHFIPIVKVPPPAAHASIPGDYQSVTKTKPSLSKTRPSKGGLSPIFFQRRLMSSPTRRTRNQVFRRNWKTLKTLKVQRPKGWMTLLEVQTLWSLRLWRQYLYGSLLVQQLRGGRAKTWLSMKQNHGWYMIVRKLGKNSTVLHWNAMHVYNLSQWLGIDPSSQEHLLMAQPTSDLQMW